MIENQNGKENQAKPRKSSPDFKADIPFQTKAPKGFKRASFEIGGSTFFTDIPDYFDDLAVAQRITRRRERAIMALADKFAVHMEEIEDQLPVDIYFNLKGIR